MKPNALFFAALCASCAFAFAGPEQIADKDMKQVAPLPPSCPTWTGFYLGAFGGYKFLDADTDLDPSDFFRTHGTAEASAIASHSPDLDFSGGEAGAVIGYNYQWRNWVFGAEAAGGYLWARDSDQTAVFAVPATPDAYVISTSVKTHYLATFGPRIGYAFCRWMPYITGGLAIGDIDYDQSFVDVGRRPRATFFSGDNVSDTNVGWMVGGGLEYSLTNHWRVRGQYQYIDLGSVDFESTGVGTLQGATVFSTGHTANLREHNASFAIIYGF